MNIVEPYIEPENAEEMATQYPDTFFIEPRQARESVPVGHNIKACFGKERFWLLVIGRTESGDYMALVNNILLGTEDHGLQCGDMVVIGPEHIYAIA